MSVPVASIWNIIFGTSGIDNFAVIGLPDRMVKQKLTVSSVVDYSIIIGPS